MKLGMLHASLALLIFGLTQSVGSAPPTYSLSISIDGEGDVTSNPLGIDCPVDCSEAYKKNTTVTLTAMPADGHVFIAWGDGCAGEDPICTVTVQSDIAVTAEFGSIPTNYPAPVSQTGQVLCFDAYGVEIDCAGTGQDGELMPGVESPIPRFTDNGDGVVTDNLSGLQWLQQADCYHDVSVYSMDWAEALTLAGQLRDGECGLTDGSQPGDWRLPTVRELLSLVDYRFGDGYYPALPNALGTGQWRNGDIFVVVNNPSGVWPGLPHWSSTTSQTQDMTGHAWAVDLMSGRASFVNHKIDDNRLFWAVKK